MAHIPNPYNNVPGQQNLNPATVQQYNQIPLSQLPGPLKQDGNLNAQGPIVQTSSQTNHFDQSASNSPAFNHPGILPPSNLQSSPMRSIKTVSTQPQNIVQNIPLNPANIHSKPSNTSLLTPSYSPNVLQHQTNKNTSSLIPSSQYSQPVLNGPLSGPMPHGPNNQYPPNSNSLNQPLVNQPIFGGSANSTLGANQRPPTSIPPGLITSQPSTQFGGNSTGPRNSPLTIGPPPNSIQPSVGSSVTPPVGLQRNNLVNGPLHPSLSPALTGPFGQPKRIPSAQNPQQGPGLQHGPQTGPLLNSQNQFNGSSVYQTSQYPSAFPNMAPSQQWLQSGPSAVQDTKQPMPGPASGHLSTSMQNRYPQMPYSNLTQQQILQVQQNIAKQFPTHNIYGVTQQMGQLSVTKQGFDQLWGHQMVDLLQCKHILPEYPEDPPEIRLGHQFSESSNCSAEIFRCTVNRIPETNSLLQKSRLPLGILIHPFKDLNHLPVIQCSTIVRCRACRTYINPFVYFVDSKRWKCNLCYRVNDLPEEFQYDPVSRSYGDPCRRPEIKSATIEFIAPSEYMLRPPQPAVYLFLLDVSQIARESGYLQVVCDTLKSNLDKLPGDARTQIGFICYDAHVHYYLMCDGLNRPKEMTVLDIEDIFLPSPESLLVNLGEQNEMIKELLTILPVRYSAPGVPASALGAALQAAYKLMAPTGGRITVFQTCLPNIGPGALQSREDPNARSSKDVAHLNPATDFYKRLALDCSGAQVAVDLFLLSSQYCDLATLSGMSKFSAGTVYHIPVFRAQRPWQADQLTQMFTRYLTRKIGFEAVMRVRCTRGVSIHTFHGNFFVRSTDLLSLPNVSPDAGFGMQLTIEESLSDLQQVCFQAALLYTSSKGERRIRVHTLALPTANTLPDVLHSADQQCIIGLLSKMAVDRCASASMSEAKEALINVAIDVLSAHRLAQNLPAGSVSSALHAPMTLRLLPLYILALMKRKAFRTGTSTRLDERVADMCLMKGAPLGQVLRAVYPDLYALHTLCDHVHRDMDVPDPPRLQLTAERLSMNGAYLLDDGELMIVYVCHGASPAFLSETFGVAAFGQLPDEARSLPRLETDGNELLHAFVDKLNDDRPYPAGVLLLRDNSPSRQLFTERLVEDRVESALSYYEFLQHVKTQVK